MSQKNTKEIFIKKAILLHGLKYDYSLVEYKNNFTKINIICSEHGIFEQRPDNHLMGQRCGRCFGKNKTTQDFISEANRVHKNKYDYTLSLYVNSVEKIKIICPEHGIFEQVSTNHINGKHGCPTCYKSNREIFIKNYLNDVGFEYEEQKRFNECKDVRQLPFDFYLPEINTCVEYDGVQHFKPFKIWGGEEGLLNRQRKDSIKTEFCKNNGIELIRFNYLDSDTLIVDKLKNILNCNVG